MRFRFPLAGLALFAAAAIVLPSQQEVVLHIREGMPVIPVALPDFVLRPASPAVEEAAAEIMEALSAALKYSRIFQLLPRSYYDFIRREPGRSIDPDNIMYPDWQGLQAKFLMVGIVSEEADGIVFEAHVHDVQGQSRTFGKRYIAKKADLRLVAHKMADEMMKTLVGEKPVFTTKIAFVSNRDGNDEIYMMDYDGRNQTRLTFNKVQDNLPAWSADQTSITYTTYRNANPDLVVRHIYEGREVMISAKGGNFSGAFSPDGRRLAFCSSRDGNSEIYVCRPDGGGLQRLTFSSAADLAPSWSPNGRQIAFTSDRSGVGMPQIYIMDAEGANVRNFS